MRETDYDDLLLVVADKCLEYNTYIDCPVTRRINGKRH